MIHPINFPKNSLFFLIGLELHKHSRLKNTFNELLKPIFNTYGTHKHLGGSTYDTIK